MQVSGKIHTPVELQEINPIPNEQEAGWAPEQVWTLCVREKSLTLASFQTLDYPTHSIATNNKCEKKYEDVNDRS
jgi:hypothetical protein